MTSTKEYLDLARDSGSFPDIELEILEDALRSWKDKPGKPYILLELRDGKILAGFAVISRAQNTEHSYDLNALCVDGVYAAMGVSEHLIAMVEEEILLADSEAVVRMELSRRKAEAIGLAAIEAKGYALIGHIPDFYGKGADYYMYAKHISRLTAEAEAVAAKEATAKKATAKEDAGGGGES